MFVSVSLDVVATISIVTRIKIDGFTIAGDCKDATPAAVGPLVEIVLLIDGSNSYNYKGCSCSLQGVVLTFNTRFYLSWSKGRRSVCQNP